MITEIEIAGVATYPAGGKRLTDLKKVNYLFGHNGCGKTTISRAIRNPSINAGYNVSWRDGRQLEALVFNRDFADASFGRPDAGYLYARPGFDAGGGGDRAPYGRDRCT
ncbi:AAA family ATPase [Ensifer aridi]|uniref:AAA family ATPase n=1 Tax=Ensifer aridi TaxID=1708715 RepID=UPI0015E3BDDE|nr:AAA family ATPase [Ensifer aridi]